MIKLKPEAGTYVANAIIPLNQVFNTNSNFASNNNGVDVKKAGFVELIGGINLTATVAGPLTINILADGNVVATSNEVAAAIGDVITVPIYDLFRVLPINILNGYANVSLQLVTPATVSSGIVTLKYIR